MREVRSEGNVREIAGLLNESEESVKQRLRPLEDEFEALGFDDITAAARRLVSVRVS
jgi:hypothetical protein